MPETPRVASEREYMRSQLPLVFRTPGAVGVDMLEALETVLDPVVAMLDGLPAYLDPATAPDDVVDLLASWLGVEDVAAFGAAQRRAAARRAAELAARRGTRAGLELALATAFPSLPLSVQDAGGVRWEPSSLGRPATAGFTVHCDTPLDEQQELAVLRLIRRFAPAGVRARLRVRERRRDGGAQG